MSERIVVFGTNTSDKIKALEVTGDRKSVV